MTKIYVKGIWPSLFRLYCGKNSSLYFQVVVWHYRKDMVIHLKKYLTDRTSDLLAICIGETWYSKSGKLSNCVGQLHFYHKYLTPESISHEITHAAFRVAERKRIQKIQEPPPEDGDDGWVNEREEKFCTLLGDMVDEFYKKARRRKLL